MNPRWRFFFPGYLIALPHTIIGLILAVVYRAHTWRISAGCIEVIAGTFERDGRRVTRIFGRPAAQTHGFLIVYADEDARADIEIRVHERVHVVQGMIGGPLYVIAYGLTFLWFYLWNVRAGWYAAYMRIPFERQAYPIGRTRKGWGA